MRNWLPTIDTSRYIATDTDKRPAVKRQGSTDYLSGEPEVVSPIVGQLPQRRTSVQRRRLPEFSELVLACQHHLAWTATWGTIVSIIAFVIAWCGTNPVFQAQSLVRVKQRQAVVYTAANLTRAEDANFVYSQKQLALSVVVLQDALADPRVQREMVGQVTKEEAVEWLQSLLDVDAQAGSEVMTIIARHPSPALSHVLSVAVTEAYLREVQTRQRTDLTQRESELDRAAREADRELQRLWDELNRVAGDIGADTSHSLTIHDEIQLQAYREYAQQLRALQLRSNELVELIRVEEARVAVISPTSDQTLQAAIEEHAELKAVREQIALLDVQIAQTVQVVASPDSPRLKKLNADRDYFVQKLNSRTEELTPQLLQLQKNKTAAKQSTELDRLKRDLEANRVERDFLRGRLEEIDTGVVAEKGENGVQLEICRHAVDRQSRLADSLWQSLEELRIESQADPRVTLISLADYPMQANSSRRYRAATAGAGMSWMLVILCIGLMEWKSCRVRHSDDLVLNSSLTVYGSDSFLDPQAPHPRSYLFGSFGSRQFKDSSLPSGVQEAAARLMLPNPHSKTIPSLMVTSAVASEPRHLAAVDLARVFARFKRRTLLIDCDPSSDALANMMLAEDLNGIRQIREFPVHATVAKESYGRVGAAPMKTSDQRLDYFPLGKQNTDGDFLDPRLLRLFLEQQRTSYDAIVVNGPAMMSSADSLLFAAQVDQTLIAVFEGVSRWNQVAAVEQLAFDTNVPLAGAVLHPGISQSTLHLALNKSDPSSQGISEQIDDDLDQTERLIREEMQKLQETLDKGILPESSFATRCPNCAPHTL